MLRSRLAAAGPLAAVLGALLPGAARAFHDLKSAPDEILGPNWWGIFVLVPIPFLAIGLILWLLWRSRRSSANDAGTANGEG